MGYFNGLSISEPILMGIMNDTLMGYFNHGGDFSYIYLRSC
jgi:hypothetical protein